MAENKTGQVTQSPAEVYDSFFVPVLFQDWTSRVADAAMVSSGQRALDVACGTGVLTCEVAHRVGENGYAAGLDLNEGMLGVAKRKAPEIEWRQGRAENLPFDRDSFDAVVCQFGLMFFEDQQAAIKEMLRVLRQDGHMALAVWDSLENTPGYAAIAELLATLFGDKAANAIRAPFGLGDKQVLRSLFTDAGSGNVQIETHEGTARFPSIRSWIYTEIKGWVLADMLDDAQYQQLLQAAESELQTFVTQDGNVALRMPAHIATVTKW